MFWSHISQLNFLSSFPFSLTLTSAFSTFSFCDSAWPISLAFTNLSVVLSLLDCVPNSYLFYATRKNANLPLEFMLGRCKFVLTLNVLANQRVGWPADLWQESKHTLQRKRQRVKPNHTGVWDFVRFRLATCPDLSLRTSEKVIVCLWNQLIVTFLYELTFYTLSNK